MKLEYIYPLLDAIGGLRTEPVTKIIVHCSAEPPGRPTGAETIDDWHKSNGWNGIGYHFVILINGEIEGGRPLGRVGAHVKGHNHNSVGVCMIGGLDANMKPTDKHYTDEQWKSLARLVEELLVKYPGATVHGHNEFASKPCPCFDVPVWWIGAKDRLWAATFPATKESEDHAAQLQALDMLTAAPDAYQPDVLYFNGAMYRRVV